MRLPSADIGLFDIVLGVDGIIASLGLLDCLRGLRLDLVLVSTKLSCTTFGSNCKFSGVVLGAVVIVLLSFGVNYG